jgi:hypothetical protein
MALLAFDPAGCLRSGFARFCANVKSTMDQQYARFFHLVVRAPSGEEGFAIFGGHRIHHHFSRVYLGERERHDVRLGCHRSVVTPTCRRLLRDYGLVVFCGTATPPELASEVLHIPLMVDLVMPVPVALDGPLAHWSRSAEADIAKLRRARFRCELQSGDSWVSEFRRRFYKPSMASRHRLEACVGSESDLRQHARAEGAEFLRIVRDALWVGGIVNQSTPDGYRLLRLGWREGEPQLLKDGVVAAMYWFSFQRAIELGHRRIMLGAVWPYLEDGLLSYKGKWGARLDPTQRRFGDLHLLVDPAHETCRRFLAAHSIVARGSNGDLIVFSGRRPGEVTVPRTILAGIARWYRWVERRNVSGGIAREEVPGTLGSWLVEDQLPAMLT